MVRDDTAVHLRRGVVGELEGGLVEREGILAYLVGDAVQEHDPFVELVHRIDRAQQDMAEMVEAAALVEQLDRKSVV